ncbi:Fur family transcriptional regulator [Candidatus Uabimicrobium sp. HlEnr_7]|uniref:Fur family transcriptional regulator n=1 Tax=Candidatus Uabimicrobium helgolandensis TaxID=3095367 RepID=UPI00355702C4
MSKNNEVSEKDIHKFCEFLKSKKLKFTTERKKILAEVHSYSSHFQAEDLLFSMRKHGVNVSKATIYRTLPVIVDCGLLRKVHLSDKQTYYEYVHDDNQPHHHFICSNCGNIIKFTNVKIDTLLQNIATEINFIVQSHIIELQGYCHDCKFAIPDNISS